MKKLINICLGVSLGCGIVVGAIAPWWGAWLGIIGGFSSVLALMELNGSNVTTF